VSDNAVADGPVLFIHHVAAFLFSSMSSSPPIHQLMPNQSQDSWYESSYAKQTSARVYVCGCA